MNKEEVKEGIAHYNGILTREDEPHFETVYYKLGDTAEEFEELFGRTPIDDIEKIKKYIFQNYLPKQIVLDKIDELENNKMECKDVLYGVENCIKILQEILKEN